MSITRWDPFRNLSSLQEQVNRLFETNFPARSDNSALTTWAPAVDIYETENELVIKADLPEISEKELDVRVENNMLTLRGERTFAGEGQRYQQQLSCRSQMGAGAALRPLFASDGK